jgi:hypothetical protein
MASEPGYGNAPVQAELHGCRRDVDPTHQGHDLKAMGTTFLLVSIHARP